MPSRKRRLSKLANELQPLLRNGSGGGSVQVSGGGGTVTPDNNYLLRSGLLAMTGNLNMGAHDIVNVGNVDGVDVSALGAEIGGFDARLDALESRRVIGGVALDDDGNTLLDGNITLDWRYGSTLTVDGSDNAQVNEAANFDWTGVHTHAGNVGSATFSSSDPIQGWKIEPDGDAWFDSIQANSLQIKTFISDVTLALQGSEFVTKSKAILSRDFTTPATTGTLYVFDLPGQPNTAVFESGDWLRLRYVNRTSGLTVADVWGTVSSYSDLADGEQSWTFTRQSGTAGITVFEGMVALDYGTTGDGFIELSSLGDDTPFITLTTWTSDPSDSGNYTVRGRFGNLSGVTDDIFGSLTGWGMYTTTAYLRGWLQAGDDVLIHPNGISLHVADDPDDSTDSLYFVTGDDLESLGKNVITGKIYGQRNVIDSDVYNSVYVTSTAGPWDSGVQNTEANVASVYVSANWKDDVSGNESAVISVQVTDGVGEATITADSIELFGNIELLGHVVPLNDSTYDLGSPSAYFRNLYVDTIYAGTTSSTDTGHNHNDLYYTESEVDTLLAGKAATSHTHAQYALATTLSSHTSDADIHREINDSGTGTTDLWSADKIASEIAATSGYVSEAMWLEHTTNTGIHATLNDSATSSSTLWSSSKINTAINAAVADLPTSAVTQDDFDTHVAAVDAHHDPVTVGDNMTLTGQLVGLASTVAITDEAKSWSAAQTFSAGILTDEIQSDGLYFADGSGNYGLIDATGIISQRPTYLSGTNQRGLKLTWDGDAYIRDLFAVGSVSSIVFEPYAIGAIGNTLVVTPAGKLHEDLSLTSVGTSVVLKVADADASSADNNRLFDLGDYLRIKAPAYAIVPTSSEGGTIPAGTPMGLTLIFTYAEAVGQASGQVGGVDLWRPRGAAGGNKTLSDAWFQVTGYSYSASDSAWWYTCTYYDGPENIRFEKGASVVSYGDTGTGHITLSSDGLDGSPYIDVATTNYQPWTNGSTLHMRMGRLSGIGGLASDEYGFIAGVDLADLTEAWLKATTEGISSQDIAQTWLDGSGNTAIEVNATTGLSFALNQSYTQRGRIEWHADIDDQETSEFQTAVSFGAYSIPYDGDAFPEPIESRVSAYLYANAISEQNADIYLIAGKRDGEAFDSSAHDTAKIWMQAGEEESNIYLWAQTVTINGEDFARNAQMVVNGQIDADEVLTADLITNGGATFNLYTVDGGQNYMRLNGIPTSSTGLPSGAIYSDSGTLKIVD